MSNNGHNEHETEDPTGIEDIYEQEPGEITEGNATSTSTVPSQLTGTQSTIMGVTPDVFIGHAARRLRLESLVSDYRDGRKSKEEALTAIHNELNKGPALSNEEKTAALRLVNEEIDSAEARTQRGLDSVELPPTVD